MDTLDGMRTFAEVAAVGSFSEAARRLGISKALASKYVGQLEERLGSRLLNRTTRKVSLTEVGRAYLLRARVILDEVAELEESVQMEQGRPRGLLRIAGPRVLGEEFLVGEVGRFLERYPDITVDLMLEERWVDIVQEGFDLAVRIGQLQDSAMVARKIADYRYVICAAPGYLAAREAIVRPADLARHAAVVNAVLAPSNQWDFLVRGRVQRVSVTPKIRVNADRSARELVRAGHGVGLCLLPGVKADLEAGRLVRLLEPYEAYARPVSVVYPHARMLSGKARAFIDHLVRAFAERAA